MGLNRQNSIYLSPLALLTLSACGGEKGNSISNVVTNTVTGNVVKGPLSNALVFLDLNSNGIMDGSETSVRTDSDGRFSISTTATDYKIVALTDDSTVDSSSGSVISGITLSAPKSAGVITPTTTLMEESGLSAAEVAEVLDLPDGVDPLNFNPFAQGVDASVALKVEKVSQQIMTAVTSFASATEGAGASAKGAFEAALTSVANVVKEKAAKLTDSNASASEKTIDFTNATDLNLIKSKVAVEAAQTAGVNTSAINALINDTATSIKNVNEQIKNLSDLSSDAAKAVFSTTQVLAEQVKEAVLAEKTNAGSGSIAFTDTDKVAKAAKNKAPTEINLSSNKVFEDAGTLIVGRLSTVDRDQANDVAFKYSIAEVDGTDYSAFEINQETGELSFKSKPVHASKPSYLVTISSTDEGGKTFSKTFTINVESSNTKLNINDPTADQLAGIAGQTDDKTLIVVIDDFSSRVHEYSNTTLYDYGYQDVVTYYDNLVNLSTGLTTGYGNIDSYFVDVPDFYGGFYKTTPDQDSTYKLDADLLKTEEFTDILGNKAFADTFLEFEKIGQQAETQVLHGDWVVEAICKTLDDPSMTQILCIDVDALPDGSLSANFGKLFQPATFVIDEVSYTASNLEKVVTEYLVENDARFNSGATNDVYALSGISMSISGKPNLDQSFFLEALEDYKIPFFQSAPNVNQGLYDFSKYFPNVISVGAWNIDADNNILAASETAIPYVDLYANGYITKSGWGENFGTSFATPTAAGSYTNLLNQSIKQLNASGQNLLDIELSDEEFAAIDYTDFVNSIVSFITQPVKTQINAFGNVLFENVNVLTETLDKDGLIPVKFNKPGIGLDGVSFISATYAENSNPPTDTSGGSSQTDENQKDTTGPTINDFWIVNNDLKLEDNITIRFNASDESGLGGLSIRFNHTDRGTGNDFWITTSNYKKVSGNLYEVSVPLNLGGEKKTGIYDLTLISLQDKSSTGVNTTNLSEDSQFIKLLHASNKKVNIGDTLTEDITGPQITHFEIVSNEINRGDKVTVRFKAEDPSGLGGLSVHFKHVDNATDDEFWLTTWNYTKAQDGFYEATLEPGNYGAPLSGLYKLNYITLDDKAASGANKTRIEFSDQFVKNLSINNKEIFIKEPISYDSYGPVLSYFEIKDKNVTIGEDLTLLIKAYDHNGLGEIEAIFRDANSNQISVYSTSLHTLNQNSDGLYEIKVPTIIDGKLSAGVYNLHSFRLSDGPNGNGAHSLGQQDSKYKSLFDNLSASDKQISVKIPLLEANNGLPVILEAGGNNSKDNAQVVLLDNVISGDIKSGSVGDSNGGKDFYKFNLAAPSEISLQASSNLSEGSFTVKIFKDGSSDQHHFSLYGSGNYSGEFKQAGDYFLELSGFNVDATYEFLLEII